MKRKISAMFCLITCAAYLSFAVPSLAGGTVPASANDGENLINRLSAVDTFHPPASGDPRAPLYKEWHYFNIIDEEQKLSFITTMTLNGNLLDPAMSSAVVLISYISPVQKNLTMEGYPVALAEWSNKTPDLKIGRSTVALTEDGYRVHVESGDTLTVFDALFEPEAEPSPVFNASYGPNRIINWLVASPKMKVTGTFTINRGTRLEKT